jgi:hypothetical protein
MAGRNTSAYGRHSLTPRGPFTDLRRDLTMTAFVQMVEMSTSRFDEMQKFNEEWRERNPDRLLDWSIVGQDRDNPGKYVVIVHFENYDVAMKNSEDPRTAEYAAKMQELSDGPITFRNLDVVTTEGM